MKIFRRFSSILSFSNPTQSLPQTISVDKQLQDSLKSINFKKFIESIPSKDPNSIGKMAQSIKRELLESHLSQLRPVTRPSQRLVYYGAMRVSNPQCLSVASVSFCLNGSGVEEVYSSQSKQKSGVL